MGDAQTNLAYLDKENKAEQVYTIMLIKYLENSTLENREKVLQEMTVYSKIYKGGEILKELQMELIRLEENDCAIWKRLNKTIDRLIYGDYYVFKEIFLNAAKVRGIGRMEWV